MVLISVIIPAYNEGKRIGGTLGSIKRQKFKDYELIVADNNSTDSTAAVAIRHARVVHAKKQGVGSARNAGARLAKGKIFFFVDADAEVGRETLASVAKAFESRGLVAATGPILPLERVNRRVGFVFRLSFNFLVRASIAARTPYFAGTNIAMRADAFRRIGGFNETLKGCEDGDISRRVAKLGRVGFYKGIRVRMSARRINRWGAGYYLFYGMRDVLGYLIRGKTNLGWKPIAE